MSFLSGVDDSNYDPVFLPHHINSIGVYKFIKWRNSQELKFCSTVLPVSQFKMFIKQNNMTDNYPLHNLVQHRDGAVNWKILFTPKKKICLKCKHI